MTETPEISALGRAFKDAATAFFPDAGLELDVMTAHTGKMTLTLSPNKSVTFDFTKVTLPPLAGTGSILSVEFTFHGFPDGIFRRLQTPLRQRFGTDSDLDIMRAGCKIQVTGAGTNYPFLIVRALKDAIEPKP